jgi:hypothetical protein
MDQDASLPTRTMRRLGSFPFTLEEIVGGPQKQK